MIGQLERLAELKKQQQPKKNNKSKFISVVSGKGGTGKTSLCINLAYALSELDKKVLLIDLDLNFANIGLMLNLYAENTLADFLNGKVLFEEVVYEHTTNLHFVLGDSGEPIPQIDSTDHIKRIYAKISGLKAEYDFVIFDNSSGINQRILYTTTNSDLTLVVATPEPTAVMDAYVSNKFILAESTTVTRGVVVNKAKSEKEGIDAFKNINEACMKFLKKGTRYFGTVEYDANFIEYVGKQKLYIAESENTENKARYYELARRVKEIGQVANNLQK